MIQPPAETPGLRKIIVTALFVVTIVLFLRAVGNDFVNYDDPDYVTSNEHVKAGLSVAGLKWALQSGEASNWHPLTWISHMLDCQLFALNPAGHHFTNVLLHSISATLLFLVLRQMTGSFWRSAFVAAVFAVHPLRVESVPGSLNAKTYSAACSLC